mmetsp:Transcript_8717/g.24356  ORF Transcript_8717/g.24356 Transcript_8717/m.24356 type:complete len:205 (+) Transcript_8717:1132-1746(+)
MTVFTRRVGHAQFRADGIHGRPLESALVWARRVMRAPVECSEVFRIMPHLRATSQRHGQDRTPLTEESAISSAKRQRLTVRAFILRARTPYRRFTRHFKLRPEVVSILVMLLHAPLVLNLHLSKSGLPDELGALTTASLAIHRTFTPAQGAGIVQATAEVALRTRVHILRGIVGGAAEAVVEVGLQVCIADVHTRSKAHGNRQA